MFMTETRVAWLIDRAFWLFLAGLALMLLAPRLHGLGSFTGLAAFCLGLCCGPLLGWKSQPRLWIISVILLVIEVAVCMLIVVRIKIIAVRNPNDLLLALDLSLGLCLFLIAALVLFRVTIVNWCVKAQGSAV